MIISLNPKIRVTPSLPSGTSIDVLPNSTYLSKHGFVMPVIVKTSSISCAPLLSAPLLSIPVMALFDTGASRTCISDDIANALALKPVGFSKFYTASGKEVFADYTIDITFRSTEIKDFVNIKVGSCNMPYNHNLPDEQRMAEDNFGVLIGRDLMSKWNIVWNGPSSSVFISE